ncbi:TonB-dependent receptor [Sphingomonas sp. RIT328]|uniref:TonB-dependent receptor n=1 Tax=Sphingomonas sp. RIT328 TaxID=1470591 RepID=UPI0004502535|nr:TonB-dependent receptor [Sphingomonas sp. RIT328]EZP48825.1 TonB-dependent receptor precursor [Sphingomonas sp. RIT328]
MRKLGYLLAAVGCVGTIGQAQAQGLRAIAPATKNDKAATDTPVAENTTDLIVTATRRSQRQSTVPIAVSAYDTVTLSRTGATDIRQVTQLAPSLIVSSTDSEVSATARLRGIGTVGQNAGIESSVAVFIDGVYRNRAGIGLNDIGEIDRIEILRGPQGTLSGRNSSAGSISIYTKYPEFTFGGYGEASYGNYNALRLAGSVTGPLIKDTLAFRIDGATTRRDGFNHDVVNDIDFNNRRRAFVRGQLFYKPQDDLSLRVIGDYTVRRERCCSTVYLDTREKYDPTPGRPGDVAFAPENRIVKLMGDMGAVLPSNGDPYNRLSAISRGQAYTNIVKDYGVSSRIGWTMGAVQLVSIDAYREYKAGTAGDFDFGSLNLVNYDKEATRQFHTFSHETRVSGAALGNRLDWLLGGYYAHERLNLSDSLRYGSDYGAFAACSMLAAFDPSGAFRDPAAPACLKPMVHDLAVAAVGPTLMGGLDRLTLLHDTSNVHDVYRQTSDNFAVFTHDIYRLTDTLSVTGGLRYTNERKTMRAAFDSGNTICGAQQTALAGLLTDPNPQMRQAAMIIIRQSCPGNSTSAYNGTRISDSMREGRLSGTAVLSWQARPSTLFYASYAHGYKAGGYNLTRAGFADNAFVTAPAVASSLRFDPETVRAIEVGAKYNAPTFNASIAAFRSDFSSFQLNTFNGAALVVQNIGACRDSLHGADSDRSLGSGRCTGDVGAGVVTRGFEVEAGVYPVRDVTFRVGYTYARARYGHNLVGNAQGAPLSTSLFLLPGNQMSNAPTHVVTESLAWTPALGRSGLSGLFYVDSRLSSDYSTGSDLMAEKQQPAYVLVNARIGLRGRDERWAVEFWSQNLLDSHYAQIAVAAYLQGNGSLSQVQRFGYPRYAVGNALTVGVPGEPRTYGLTVRSRF